MKKIFISAGDPSGDVHAALLMEKLRAAAPDVSFEGIGGPEMARQGLKSIAPMSRMSVVGFWEVAKNYRYFLNILDQCKRTLSSGGFSAFIPVDYPGFNIRLASFAKSRGAPVVYYIAPQLWAWGGNRAKKLASCVDKILAVFPFEPDYFGKFGIDAEFVGHPLLDNPAFQYEMESAVEKRKLIAILPGSRRQEVVRHIPLASEIVRLLWNEDKSIEIGAAVSPSVDRSLYKPLLKGPSACALWDDSRALMKESRAGLVKTGTSTLEAALCGTPFTMFYKTSALTYAIGKRLVNLEYISLVNIIAKKALIKEFIQREARPENICAELMKLCSDEEYRSAQTEEFTRIRSMLGGSGASERAAGIIREYLL